MEEFVNVVLDDGAFIPLRGHAEDAGLDLRTPKRVTLKAHSSVSIDTGTHVEIPYGYVGELESKSGLNVKHDIVSCGGTIDSGFTSSITAKLFNFGDEDYTFEAGDKIVQLVIHPVWLPKVKIVDKLPDAERGSGAFGSTGR